MKMTWKLLEQTDAEPSVMPCGVLLALLFIVVVAVVNLFGLADWLQAKTPFTLIVFKGLLVPALIALTATFIFYMGAFCRLHVFQMRQFRTEVNNYLVTAYSRRCMTLVAWQSLAPVQHIALKMLKLEGAMPLAPETPLNIDCEERYEAPRLEIILKKLIEPLKEKLNEPYLFDVSLWARAQDADAENSVGNALKAAGINMKNVKKISVMDICPGYSLLEKWINQLHSQRNFYHLLLIADIHAEDKNDFMENASAFLFGYYSSRAEKPLFISIPLTDKQNLETAAVAFIKTKRMEAAKVLWHTGLERKEKYPLFEVLNQVKTAPDRLDMDTAFGKRSAGYQWLALALAADAVRYAQGPQLMAASGKNEFGLLSLGDSWCREPEPPERFVPLPVFGAVMSTLLMLGSLGLSTLVYSKKELLLSLTAVLLITALTALILGGIAWVAVVHESD